MEYFPETQERQRPFINEILTTGHSLYYCLQDCNTECDSHNLGFIIKAGLDSKACKTGTKANLSKETNTWTPYQ